MTLASIGISYINLKNLSVRKILEGEPVVVIQNGNILEENFARLRYNIDDLEMQLRENGVFDFTQVEFAILEPSGHLGILRKSQHFTPYI